MARLPALVKKYAELDGRPERQIQWFARMAREQGLITNGKRGVGASHMTFTDAANLIIVCNSEPDPKLAPTTAEQIREFSQAMFFEDEQEIVLKSLRAVIEAERLGDALDLLISSAPEIQAELLALDDGNARTEEKIRNDPFDARVGLDVILGPDNALLVLREAHPVLGDIPRFRLEYARSGARNEDTRVSRHRQTRTVLSLEVFRACRDLVAGDEGNA